MPSILDYLNTISDARYGRDVRQAIVDAISACYQDGKAGVSDLEARRLIESAIGVNESQQADIDTLYAQIADIQGGGDSSQESTTITLDTVIYDGGFVDSVTVNNNATKTYDVTFTQTFTEVPEVFACVAVQNSAAASYSKVTVGIVKAQTTKTGFRFFIANTSGATRSTTVVWAAFQPTTKEIDLDITIPSGDGMSEADVLAITNPIQSSLNGIKTGYDGTVYSTPGEAVREQINDLHVLIGDEPGTAISGSSVDYDGTDSGLSATDMQSAVDEVADALSSTNERLGNLEDIKSESIMDGVEWARGTIYPDTGRNGASTTRIRTVDYMDMTGVERISVSINSGYKYALFWYDSEKTFIKLYNSGVYKTEEQVIVIPADVAYMRICVADASDGTASVDYADELLVGVYSDVVNTVLTLDERTTDVEGRTSVYDTALAVENRLIANTESDWEQGTINVNTGADADETTAIRTDYIAVYSFENINVSVESGYRYCVLFYDFVKGYMKTESLTAFRTSPVKMCIPDGACYVRVKIASTTSGVVLAPSDYANISLYLQPKLFGRLMEGDREDVVVVQRHKKQEAYSFKFRRTGSASYDNCDLLMMFITDIHQHWNMCERTKQLVNNWGSDYVDMVVCGGDIPKVYGTENVDSYFTAFSDLSVPLLNVVGNHEYLTSGGDQTREAVYAKFIAPIVSTADIVQPTGASTNGLNYYYKDNGAVRIIAIDCMSWDADQLAWFEGVLADARTNSKHVLCVSHCPFPDNIMTLVDCLWSKSVFTILDQHKTSVEAAQAVKTFMDNGGNFVGWVIGHLHADLIFKLADYGNQFVFTLSAFHSLYASIIKSEDKADYNYDSMTYIAVDTMHNIIKLLRIGADIDVTGTKHNGLSVNYATKTVISDW